jgi:hypothetical protein
MAQHTSLMNTTEAQRFGIEIETVGLTREAMAKVIAAALGCEARFEGGYYDKWVAVLADGRKWTCMTDGSLSSARSAEIVSPILTYADMEMLQTVVRAARAAGARTDDSCGIHVHVDGANFTAKSVLNLVNMVHKQERLIERALGVSGERLRRWCKPIDAQFVASLGNPRTIDDLKAAWYRSQGATESAASEHYNFTRYHGVNLHSLFYRGTIEFRYFDATLHAGEVKAYVQLCLALADAALKRKATSRARRAVDSQNEKWQFRVFLKNLGLVGEEFKTLRLHLTKNLAGKANRTRPVAP